MNIVDIKEVLDTGGKDKLDLIFEMQRKLKEKYDKIEKEKGFFVPELPINIDDCLTQEYLKSQAYRIVSELVEATECLKNKAWKQTETFCDVDHFMEEVSDSFHFFIELCIVLGITSENLFQLYFKKMKVNEWRVRTRY